jgi:hypothetical protein
VCLEKRIRETKRVVHCNSALQREAFDVMRHATMLSIVRGIRRVIVGLGGKTGPGWGGLVDDEADHQRR